MSIVDWQEETTKILARSIGPVAEIIVDETAKNGGFQDKEMAPANYLKFLEALYKELPDDIDRKEVIYLVRDLVLRKYGFSHQ